MPAAIKCRACGGSTRRNYKTGPPRRICAQDVGWCGYRIRTGPDTARDHPSETFTGHAGYLMAFVVGEYRGSKAAPRGVRYITAYVVTWDLFGVAKNLLTTASSDREAVGKVLHRLEETGLRPDRFKLISVTPARTNRWDRIPSEA